MEADRNTYDAVFYGATPASIVGAIALQRCGGTAVIVGGWRERHLGGMMSGGLGGTDILNGSAVGGLAKEVFDAISVEGGHKAPRFKFEPRHAEHTFKKMIADSRVSVFWSKGVTRVEKQGARITCIHTADGQAFRGRVFVDASYEGDLMARAGISYVVGREARDKRNPLGGFRGRELNARGGNHNWTGSAADVDPFVIPGDPSSGLIRGITARPDLAIGHADKQVQAYCFRLILTTLESRIVRLPSKRPSWFDPADYELLFRRCQALTDHGLVFGKDYQVKTTFLLPKQLNPDVWDMNNRGPFSTDFIGGSWSYPEANYEERELIWNSHERYIRGFFYALQHHPDPRVPNGLRRRMRAFGLDRLNFVEPVNGDEEHWPYQLYVRESRRMVSDVVWSGADLFPETADIDRHSKVIASTLYRTDSHHGQRFAEQLGGRWSIWNEGGFERRIGVASRAPIPYDVVVPRRHECTNLLIGFCVSATHDAFGAIRMEPTLMTIGEAIGVAAAIIREQPELAVQDVPYDRLRARLSVSKIAPVLPTWPELINKESSADRESLVEKSVLLSLVGRKVVLKDRTPNDVATFNNQILGRESAVPLLDQGSTPADVPQIGRFRVGRWRGKLVVAGTVKASEREVYIAINDQIIRVANTSTGPGPSERNFKFAFGASVLRLLPAKAFVSVSSRGGLLASETGGRTWPLNRSKGTGVIFDRLKQGWTIDKWGQIAIPISEKPAWRQAVLDAYERFAAYAAQQLGIEMYFVAGTLLGAVREGNFIAHDDDMDVGYFSKHTKAEDVRDEMFEMIRRIRADGWRLRIAHNRGFFQILAGVSDAKFDVFPAWYEGGYIWMHNSQRIPAPPEIMIPPRPATFLGRSVLFPNQPEAYLAQHYGPTWRVPDKHYQETKQSGVLEGLRRARLTPDQIASLKGIVGEGNKSVMLNEGKLPLVWWNQTSNFGDLLSPWLASRISGKEVVYADHTKPHYLAVGSVLDKANDNSIVWGSGSFGTESRSNMPKGATYLATRGPLTRNKIDTAKLRCPRIYGDPALLVPRYYPRTKEPDHELGLIVRWSETNLREGINVEGVKLIDFARGDIEAVIDDILSCKRIFSSSLHGLILADAYGIPNAWKVSNSPKGREFKFWDYFISVGKLRPPSTFKLLRPDLTLHMMLDGIEFDGREIDIDLEALLEACPFRA